jgi:hypothetical protein
MAFIGLTSLYLSKTIYIGLVLLCKFLGLGANNLGTSIAANSDGVVVSTGGAPIYSTADGLNWTQQGEQDIIYM